MIKIGKDEKIILEIRKHWFVLFSKTLFLVFLLALPVIIAVGANILNLSKFVTLIGDGTYISIILTSVWLLFIWITFFVIWTDYYLDILIITDKRIIDINQKRLFSRDISVSQLDHIEDVSTEIHGLIATLLNFGNIQIQTAGENREFIVQGVPNPDNIRRQIMEAHKSVS
jgi:uncharacterized membrane protein YdbT with pleckstrin-like domain